MIDGPVLESGIPIPPVRSIQRKARTRETALLVAMGAGDSFAVDSDERKRMETRMRVWGKKLGRRYTGRTVVERGRRVFRIWRTA